MSAARSNWLLRDVPRVDLGRDVFRRHGTEEPLLTGRWTPSSLDESSSGRPHGCATHPRRGMPRGREAMPLGVEYRRNVGSAMAQSSPCRNLSVTRPFPSGSGPPAPSRAHRGIAGRSNRSVPGPCRNAGVPRMDRRSFQRAGIAPDGTGLVIHVAGITPVGTTAVPFDGIRSSWNAERSNAAARGRRGGQRGRGPAARRPAARAVGTSLGTPGQCFSSTTPPTQPGPRCGPTDGPTTISWTRDSSSFESAHERRQELLDVGVGRVQDRGALERRLGEQLERPARAPSAASARGPRSRRCRSRP